MAGSPEIQKELLLPLNSPEQFTRTREALWQLGREIILAAPQLYIDADVEADGIPGYGSMVAIGSQSPTGESFKSEIKPNSEHFIPRQRKFCEEHGLERARLLVEAPEADEVMAKYQDWVRGLGEKYGKKPVLAAFGPDFDAGFIKQYSAQAGLYDEYPFALLPQDLKTLALPFTDSNWDWDGTIKDKLPKIIVPDGDFTHDPLEDSQYQQKLHFGLAGLHHLMRSGVDITDLLAA